MRDEARPRTGTGGASRPGSVVQAPGLGHGTCPNSTGPAGDILVTRHVAGVAMTRREPRRNFLGVMLGVPRAGSPDGYTLSLAATDGTDIVLTRGIGEDDVVARWRATAATLGMPALVRHADGEIEVLQRQFGGIAIGPTLARRRRAVSAKRRPRFLKRRKTGWAAAAKV